MKVPDGLIIFYGESATPHLIPPLSMLRALLSIFLTIQHIAQIHPPHIILRNPENCSLIEIIEVGYSFPNIPHTHINRGS